MPLSVDPSPFALSARAAASQAAERAGVRIVDAAGVQQIRDIADLLSTLWGATDANPPMPADVLRGMSHAGSSITAAYTPDGELCGAAVGIAEPADARIYSLIAGVAPSAVHAGVGFAMKQHQRAWALERGFSTITWTFDPLVGRNGRFNLTKLGAVAGEYIDDFYGPMDDEINRGDASDRLVAHWSLTSDRTIECSAGAAADVAAPTSPREYDHSITAPDRLPVLFAADGALWCRTPDAIVSMRRTSPAAARAWRAAVRVAMTTALAEGHVADAVTRDGWYRFTQGELST